MPAVATKQYIAAEIRAARARRNLKQSDLAKLVGVSPYTISRIETGHREVSGSYLCAIAEALDVPVEALFPPSNRDGAKK